jgi:hypothetical protein
MKTIIIIIIVTVSLLIIGSIIALVVLNQSNNMVTAEAEAEFNEATFDDTNSDSNQTNDNSDSNQTNDNSDSNQTNDNSDSDQTNETTSQMPELIDPETLCSTRENTCCTYISDSVNMISGYSCTNSTSESSCTGDNDVWCAGPEVVYSEFAQCDDLYISDISWGGSYIGNDLTDSIAIVYNTLYDDDYIVNDESDEEFAGYTVLVGVANSGNKSMLKCVLINYYADGEWEQIEGSAKYFISETNTTSLSNIKILKNYNSSTHSIPDDKYKINSITLNCYEGLSY